MDENLNEGDPNLTKSNLYKIFISPKVFRFVVDFKSMGTSNISHIIVSFFIGIIQNIKCLNYSSLIIVD